jgi:hypothetical protein
LASAALVPKKLQQYVYGMSERDPVLEVVAAELGAENAPSVTTRAAMPNAALLSFRGGNTKANENNPFRPDPILAIEYSSHFR